MRQKQYGPRRWVTLAFCAGAIIQPSQACAEVFEVSGSKYNVAADHIVRKEPIASLFTLLDVAIWKDTLDDVKKRLGPSRLLPRAEHQAKRVCYRSSDLHDGPMALFFADAPGSWNRITGFRLSEELDSAVDTKFCHSIKQVVKSTSLGGLTIGVSRQVFRQTLGPPASELPQSELRVYEFREPLSESELNRLQNSFPELRKHPFLAVTMLVHSEFKADRLSAIEVHVVKELPSK
jgi:hypothetical protein